MRNLIDSTYFKGLLSLPDLNVSTNNDGFSSKLKSEILDDIDDYITRYEKEYLVSVLGIDIYTEFITNYFVPIPIQKWTDLVAKLVDSDNKISPIANYVYFSYLNNKEVELAFRATSVTKKVDNSNVVSNYPKMKIAWDNMVTMNKELFTWLQENSDTYCTEYDYDYTSWNGLLENQHYGL